MPPFSFVEPPAYPPSGRYLGSLCILHKKLKQIFPVFASKFFPKTLDKPQVIWYNYGVPKRYNKKRGYVNEY